MPPLGERLVRLATLLALGDVHAQPSTTSCGKRSPSPVADCHRPDLGSCANACCKVALTLPGHSTTTAYANLTAFLKQGGDDASYSLANAPDAAGHNPTPDLRPFSVGYDYLLQAKHKTATGYIDTLNVDLRTLSDGATGVVGFSISDIHGALGDNSQNYKNLAALFRGAFGVPSSELRVLFGCGASP